MQVASRSTPRLFPTLHTSAVVRLPAPTADAKAVGVRVLASRAAAAGAGDLLLHAFDAADNSDNWSQGTGNMQSRDLHAQHAARARCSRQASSAIKFQPQTRLHPALQVSLDAPACGLSCWRKPHPLTQILITPLAPRLSMSAAGDV